MKRQDVLAWIVVVLGSAFAASIPFFYFHATLGTWLPAILPELEADTLYYLAQIQEVLDGKWWLGNPYILEHAGEKFPGLLLPIWLAAIPGFFGLGPNGIFAFNAIFWSVVSGALLFMLCSQISGNRILSATLAIVGVALLHNLLIRPAVMQTVYPFILLFLMALFAVLKHPKSIRSHAGLGLTAIIAFYLYPYFWVFAFTTLGLLTFWRIAHREWAALKILIVTGLCIIVGCAPHIVTVWKLFQDPAAHELNVRIGLVATHRVLPLTILNMKYVIGVALAMMLLLLRKKLSPAETFIFLTASAAVIGSVSNIVTGQELDFHGHFWRTWLPLQIIVFAVLWKSWRTRKETIERGVIILCAGALLFTTINRIAWRANAYAYLLRSPTAEQADQHIQEYKDLFAFFNKQDHSAIILAPTDISRYVPIYTKHYVLFGVAARLHLISNDELLERFLLQHVDRVDAAFLTEHIIDYRGAGPLHAADYARAYGKNVDLLTLIGGWEFLEAAKALHARIDDRYTTYLHTYGVDFVVIDKTAEDTPREPSFGETVYEDERFHVLLIRDASKLGATDSTT